MVFVIGLFRRDVGSKYNAMRHFVKDLLNLFSKLFNNTMDCFPSIDIRY